VLIQQFQVHKGPAGADSTVPGPQGPQGLPGDTGVRGPPGVDSTVPGPPGPTGPAFLELPISHYRFEQNVLDSEGGNHGTVTGTETYVPGQKAFAFDFDGSTHIETADTPFDFTKDDAFSLAAWVQTSTSGATDVLIGKLAPGGIGYQVHLTGGNEIRFKIGSSVTNSIMVDTVGATIRDGIFHHIAVTYDGSSSASGVEIYIDGTLSKTSTVKDTLTGVTTNAESLVIGNQRDTAKFFFTGQIDDVLIFNNELTAAQVATISGF